MSVELDGELRRRAVVHAALGEPARLAIVDLLALGDAAPSELGSALGLPSNLLTHHVGVLERAGVLRRRRSEADRRRIYLGLVPEVVDSLRPVTPREAARVVFVCTENSARSQLAAALWVQRGPVPAASAGIRPARRVHPGAVAAARRHRLPMRAQTPRSLPDALGPQDVVITVCDNAHEELDPDAAWLHWSVADPARPGDDDAFDRALRELTARVTRVAPTVRPTETGATDD